MQQKKNVVTQKLYWPKRVWITFETVEKWFRNQRTSSYDEVGVDL